MSYQSGDVFPAEMDLSTFVPPHFVLFSTAVLQTIAPWLTKIKPVTNHRVRRNRVMLKRRCDVSIYGAPSGKKLELFDLMKNLLAM